MVDAVQAVQALQVAASSAAPSEAQALPDQNAFIEVLKNIDASVANANEALEVAAKGESQAPVHELMIALEVSKLQLQMLVEVRNRVVEGYQELTRMQV